MATIKVENRKFVIAFSEVGRAHFRSFYSPSGRPLALRQPDLRDIRERYGKMFEQSAPRKTHGGIYQARSLGDYLVFLDHLKSESQVYFNWRSGSARSYRRAALGKPAFSSYGRSPYPCVSHPLLAGGRFYVAWLTDDPLNADLILSCIDPKTAARHDTVICGKMQFGTTAAIDPKKSRSLQPLRLVHRPPMVSLAGIGSRGLVVCHHSDSQRADSGIEVFPVKL